MSVTIKSEDKRTIYYLLFSSQSIMIKKTSISEVLRSFKWDIKTPAREKSLPVFSLSF